MKVWRVAGVAALVVTFAFVVVIAAVYTGRWLASTDPDGCEAQLSQAQLQMDKMTHCALAQAEMLNKLFEINTCLHKSIDIDVTACLNRAGNLEVSLSKFKKSCNAETFQR